MLVDSHCHLTDARFQDDRSAVLTRAVEAGVGRILTVCSDIPDAGAIVELLDDCSGLEECPAISGTVGVHPHYAEGIGADDLDTLRTIAGGHDGIVAIGETGLDFFYDNSPREAQEESFRNHLELAEELDLPVVVHSRSADLPTQEILREWGGRVRGVLHCFAGGEPLLKTALSVGWMISFTGIITFKKYDGLELVRSVPSDRLMIETDGPYLAPIPHRGKRNEPAFVTEVAKAMAAIRDEHPEEVRGYTYRNADSFLGIEE